MEADATELAGYLVKRLEEVLPSQRLLVGIAGIPAAGKSTFSQLLTDQTNALLAQAALNPESHLYSSKPAQAILVALDGWHLTRAALDLLPDKRLAYDKRGSHWTFDGAGYVDFVRSLRTKLMPETPVITAPSFDHALKDPTPHAVSIHNYHRIVIIEGLYTLLSIAPWNEGGMLLDERWLLRCETDEAQRRLVTRHVATGVTSNLEEAIWRAEENDLPNGRFIMTNMLEPTRIIESKDEDQAARKTE